MATAHLNAKQGEIAKTVFFCGDPLRAKKFSEKHLTNYKIVSDLRGILVYTGILDGKEISIMGHGMGLNSVGIYAYELFKFYGVDNLIRFGSCGSYLKNKNLLEIVVAEEAYTSSNYGLGFGETSNTLKPSRYLLDIAREVSKENPKYSKVNFSNVNASPWFYKESNIDSIDKLVKQGIHFVEMEAYAIYLISNFFKKNSLTILTVSDNLITKEELPGKDRENKFDEMFNFLREINKKIN